MLRRVEDRVVKGLFNAADLGKGDRRTFIKQAATTTFGVLAALAVFRKPGAAFQGPSATSTTWCSDDLSYYSHCSGCPGTVPCATLAESACENHGGPIGQCFCNESCDSTVVGCAYGPCVCEYNTSNCGFYPCSGYCAA